MKQFTLAFALLPALAAAQSAETVLYAATDAGVQRSTSLGRVWTRLSDGLDGAQIASLVGMRNDSRVLYAAANTGIFKTSDGERWTRVLNEPRATSVAVDPADEQRVYAAASGKLFTSDNGGRDWTSVATPFPAAVVAVDPYSSVRLYITATHNYDLTFAATTSRGESWQTFGWRSTFPFLTFDASTPGRLYTSIGGLLQSSDRGQTWTDVGPYPSDLMGVLPDDAHFAAVRSIRAATTERERPGDVHTCIEARWIQLEDPEDIQGPYTTGDIPGWASYVSGLWAAGQLPGDQPCTSVVRICAEDATFYAAGSKIYRRNGLLGRRVDLAADLGSLVRSLDRRQPGTVGQIVNLRADWQTAHSPAINSALP